jgi:heat-inducible transcriptional repressor
MNLSQRQGEILEGICREYIKDALPISSGVLKEKEGLPFSSATIRNELVCLEKQGFLFHPYVSSGRIPTDKGFRFFVNKILQEEDLAKLGKGLMEKTFSELRSMEDFLNISHQVTKDLSKLSSGLVLTYLPEQNILWKEGWEFIANEPEFRNIENWKEFLNAVSDFEENVGKFDWQDGAVKVYIGEETPFQQNKLSIVITKIAIPERSEEMIAILGPKRMDFEKNIGFLSAISNILEDF